MDDKQTDCSPTSDQITKLVGLYVKDHPEVVGQLLINCSKEMSKNISATDLLLVVTHIISELKLAEAISSALPIIVGNIVMVVGQFVLSRFQR